MKIEIRQKNTRNVIVSGDYENIRECVENNRAYLEGAYLGGVNLGGAYLGGANLRGANLGGANLRGANLRGANLRGANLESANLGGVNLRGANLEGVNLEGANLESATGYLNSHDIFQEAIKRQISSVFNDAEWSTIAQIIIYQLCWNTIEQRFSNVVPHIFEILASAGFTEWIEHWNQIRKEK